MVKLNILDYIFPPRCPMCEKVYRGGICPSCREEIHFVDNDFCMKCGKPITRSEDEFCNDCRRKKHYFTRNRGMLSYQGPVRNALIKLKYENRKDYGTILGHEMAHNLKGFIQNADVTVIIPIPLYKGRKRVRGYNQAEVIARAISEDLNIPMDTGILLRVRKTRAQKGLNDVERIENLSKAFKVNGGLFDGDRVLLVDDIYTTGSTMDSAAICLRKFCDCEVFSVTAAIGG